MQAVTIAARNYLPFARLLARSFLEHNPESSFVVLLVDAEPGEIAAADGYDVATPGDLPMELAEFRRLAMIYDVTELCTALKPWALQMLLERGAEVAIYLDPDILVYDQLGDVERLSQEHGIVLTPHAVAPMRRDGLLPSEADIMGSGVYNLGFIAVGSNGLDMLKWWQQRLLRDAISAPQQNLFTDQRWIDLVPGLFDHVVLRDPGYNVAYWNLDSRTVERGPGGAVLVDGRPLRFFHFSGYRPESPWLLSKYVAERPRVVLSEVPVVQELCASYGAAALAEGIEAAARTPYGFGQLGNGVTVTRAMRRTYRQALIDAEDGDTPLPPAAFSGADDAVLDWLREPLRRGHAMNRVIHGAWRVRPDLQASFPEPMGADESGLLAWAVGSALAEGELVPQVLPSAADTGVPPWRASDEAGLNVSGYLTAELGMGQCGRLVVQAAKESGLPLSTTTWTKTVSRTEEEFEDVDAGLRYPVNVAMVNADQIPVWAEEVGSDLMAGRYTIGVWAWEVEQFPAMYGEALELVDEVWAISAFVRDAIARVTTKPVHVFPVPASAPATSPAPLDREALGLPAGPMYLFAFDYMSVFQRKNPLAAVAAFCAAFDDGEGPILVIKTINGNRHRSDREHLRAACSRRRDIFLLEEYLSGKVVKSLMADATCYVSLHRSEGYGLTMAEAMTLGVPVVATGYSGNVDFMTEDDSLLVPYELVPVAKGSGPYPVTARWAEPDVAVAAGFLRKIHDDPDFGIALGRRGRAAVLAAGRLERSADFVRERVAYAMTELERSPEKFADRGTCAPGGALQRARSLIRSPQNVDTPSRMPFGVARKLRLVINRLLTHHDEQVNERLEAVLEAVVATGAESAATALEMRESATSRLDDISRLLEAINARTELLDTEMVARPYVSDPELLRHRDELGRQHLAVSQAHNEASYRGFEDTFRGSEAFVADRLLPYLGMLRDKAPVLDVGCGRGELLGLLSAVDVAASGVDLDASMLERCQAKGLDVELGDAVEVLDARDVGSLGAVTSFQVVEHLELSQLRALFEAAQRVLRPGGVLVAETVNPHSPGALKTFWLDLTHVRPLYPEAMLFLALEAGFQDARIFFPQAVGNLDDDLRHCGEYALIATKS